MKWICHALMAVILGTFSAFTPGCVTPGEVPMKIEKSLAKDQLAYYSESFDKLRNDLWDRAGFAFEEVQLKNIKLADIAIESGKLVIKTKTGAYSKGGLGSRFALRGDFDIQIDCQIDFFRGRLRMDQIINFIVVDKTADYEKMNIVAINLVKKGGALNSYLVAGYRKLGNFKKFGYQEIDNFNGSLRIVRLGSKVSASYKEGSAEEWHEMGSVSFNTSDVMVSFFVTNFVADRKEITASKSITVTLDNFRINAAQEIVEEEI
jgi:hypothetical protein